MTTTPSTQPSVTVPEPLTDAEIRAIFTSHREQIEAQAELLDNMSETLDHLLAADESETRLAFAVRHWKVRRHPKGPAELSLLWAYMQWTLHCDDIDAYQPLPLAMIEKATIRQKVRRERESAEAQARLDARRGSA